MLFYFITNVLWCSLTTEILYLPTNINNFLNITNIPSFYQHIYIFMFVQLHNQVFCIMHIAFSQLIRFVQLQNFMAYKCNLRVYITCYKRMYSNWELCINRKYCLEHVIRDRLIHHHFVCNLWLLASWVRKNEYRNFLTMQMQNTFKLSKHLSNESTIFVFWKKYFMD